MSSVDADGNPFFVRGLQDCVGAATTNCVQPDGKFTVTNLPAALYKIAFHQEDATHADTVFNVSMSGNADIGVVPLLRTPFDVDMTIGQIPPFGGSIPLAARAQTLWDIPTLPITVNLRLVQQDVNNAGGTLVEMLGTVVALPGFDFTWPAGLSDSGVVALPPINVRSSAPAGAESCVVMTIVLRNQPDLRLGQAVACGGKQP